MPEYALWSSVMDAAGQFQGCHPSLISAASQARLGCSCPAGAGAAKKEEDHLLWPLIPLRNIQRRLRGDPAR